MEGKQKLTAYPTVLAAVTAHIKHNGADHGSVAKQPDGSYGPIIGSGMTDSGERHKILTPEGTSFSTALDFIHWDFRTLGQQEMEDCGTPAQREQRRKSNEVHRRVDGKRQKVHLAFVIKEDGPDDHFYIRTGQDGADLEEITIEDVGRMIALPGCEYYLVTAREIGAADPRARYEMLLRTLYEWKEGMYMEPSLLQLMKHLILHPENISPLLNAAYKLRRDEGLEELWAKALRDDPKREERIRRALEQLENGEGDTTE